MQGRNLSVTLRPHHFEGYLHLNPVIAWCLAMRRAGYGRSALDWEQLRTNYDYSQERVLAN